MARPIEVPVVVKKGSLARSIEGEATTAMRKLGGSSTAVQPLGRMLGKIRADADEFTKSIEASNARVIAFGASVGVINGISNAFKSLVATTIKIEKSMADINIVLGASEKSLAKFGDGLFKVAKNTAQSFDVVTEAATEFARQGLNIEETLKRTNDALILTRLTGLKAADSVKGLTAAVNGFGKAGLTTTQIINKLSAVDVKFAVGTDDLINALGRAGAVAQDAGVNFDELVALVTVAQQKTARGGAVIGNAFKTIYTRMQDPRALQALRQVGVAVDDVRGAALPANRVLQNLAQTYDSLNRSQKATIDQFVAGKFQINILKSVLGDLNTVNGEYARAQQVSIGATDQAIQKNETLNKTMAALATQSGLALDELAKKVGDLSLGPGMRNILQSFNALVEGATKGLDGEGTGSSFAKGLLRGIGGVLTGPGLFIIGGVFIKLFKDLTVFGVKSLKNLLGLNNASKQQAALQQGIGQLLATNVKYQTAMVAAEGNIAKQAAITQRFLASEVILRERAAAASAKLAASAYAGGFGVSAAGMLTRGRSRGRAPSFAPTGGEVPNFAMGRFAYRSPLTLATADPAIKEVMKVSGTKLEKYLPKTSGFRDAAVRLRKEEGFAGVDLSMANTLGLSGSQQPGLMAGMRGALKANPIQGIPSDLYGARNIQELGTSMSALYRSNPAAAGKFNQRMSDQVTEDYINKTMGLKSMGGTQGADTIFDSLKIGPGGIKNPVEIKKRLQDEATRGTLVKKSLFSETAPELRNFFMKNATKAEKRAMEAYLDKVWLDQYSAYSKSGIAGFGRHKGSADKIAAVRSYHKAVNFAPIGDAIQREKHQVGGLLGINPSQVKTRVVQNTALKSSFNPGGFGVISPTIGQNSFGDAARMHRGEDLRTTNLPNFAFGDVFSTEKGKGMTFAKPSFEKILDPGAAGTVDVKVVGHSEKALKSLEKAYSDPMERRSRLEKGTRLSGMTGVAGDVADPRSAGAIRRRIMRPIGAAGRGLGAIGGAAMGPAFTAMMMGEMLQGFNPPPTASQRFGMTAGQRVSAGRANRASQGATWGGAGGALAGAGVGFAVGGLPGAAAGSIYGGLGGGGLGALGGWVQGGSPYLTDEEREQRVGQVVEERQTNLGMVDQARSAMLEAASLRSDPQRYKEALSKARNRVQDITDPDLKAAIMVQFNQAEKTGFLETGIKKMGAAATTGAAKMSETITGLRGGSAIGTLLTQAEEGDLTPEQKKQFAARFAALPVDEQAKVTKLFQSAKAADAGRNDFFGLPGARPMEGIEQLRFGGEWTDERGTRSEDLASQFQSLGMNKEGAIKMFQRATRGGAYEDFFERGAGTIQDYIMLQNQANQNQNITTGGGGPPDDPNVYKRFLEMQRRLRETQITNQQAQTRATAGAPARQLRDQTGLGILGRIGGQRATIGERYRTSMIEANLQAGLQRQGLSTQYGGKLSAMIGKDIPTVGGQNEKLISDLTGAFEGGDISKAQAIFKDVDFDKHIYKGKKLEIASMLGLEDLSKQLENAAEIVNINIDAQENYIEAQKKTAEMLDKNGVLIAGIEGFRNSLQDAFMSIADPSLSGGDIARNFAMGILGSIQQQASSNVADFVSGSLFGDLFKKKDKQSGGIISAQNGMYISGNRSGDKNPAMLEDGEYVLNRNAVKMLGGSKAIDGINFGMAPRFQGGGSLQGGGFSDFIGSIGKGITMPFEWIGELLSKIFKGGGGGRKSYSRGLPTGSSNQAKNVRSMYSIEQGIQEMQKKESILGQGIKSWGTGVKDFSKTLSGEELSESWRVILGLGKSHGGKEAMRHYDSQVRFHGASAFDKLIGADNKPMGRSGIIDILKRSGVRGFQGGGVFSGVPSKHRKKALEKFGGSWSMGSYGGGSAFGGGGMSLGLDFYDPRLSSLAHANDPTLQAMRGIFREERQKDIQKKFEKQAKRDQLTQAVVGTAISLGLEDATTGFKGLKAMGSGMKKGWGKFKDWVNPPDVIQQDLLGSHGMPAWAIGSHGGERGQYRTLSDIGGGRQGSQQGPGFDFRGGFAADVYRYNLERYNRRVPINTRRQAAAGNLPPGAVSEYMQRKRLDPTTGISERDRVDLMNAQTLDIPLNPPKTGSIVDSTDFPSGRKLVPLSSGHRGTTKIGPGTGPEGALKFLYKESSRLLERIDRATKRLEGLSKEQRDFELLQSIGDRHGLPRQRGGSIDNVPAMLTGGEFVVNAGAVKKYGSNTLNNMNRFQTGGMVGSQKFVPGEESSSKKQAISEPSTNNNTVNISINSGGGVSANASEDFSGTSTNSAAKNRELGRKIKDAVLQVIQTEKRIGGSLRNPYAKEQ